MSVDDAFVRRLQDLGEMAPPVAVAADSVWAGHRRRRAARATATVAVAGVGALVATTTALGGPLGLTAPGGSQPDPSGPAASIAAVTVPSDGFVCGAPPPAISDPAGTEELQLDLVLPQPPGADPTASPGVEPGRTLTAGDLGGARLEVLNGSSHTLAGEFVKQGAPVLWLVRDGVVVGSVRPEERAARTAVPDDPAERARWAPGDVLTVAAGGPVTWCEGAPAFAPGELDLYATHAFATGSDAEPADRVPLVVTSPGAPTPEVVVKSEGAAGSDDAGGLTLAGGPWVIRFAVDPAVVTVDRGTPVSPDEDGTSGQAVTGRP